VRRVRVSMRCARRMHGVCAPLRPNLYSFSGTRRQLSIEAVSHVKFALTLPQPFLWILKCRPSSDGCQLPDGLNGTGWQGDGIRDHQVELKPPLGGISSFGGGHRHAWCWQILLQKSKIEELQISRKSTLRCFRCCAVLVGSIRRPVVDRVRNDVLPHVAACTHTSLINFNGQSKQTFSTLSRDEWTSS
jgi:hypothetical protein